ncbi:MAG TPA: outer membrane protein assembly factor BamB [Gammaproteobacteria bacterium]|jgi:outer membrane protein assembly factor BamB
MKARIWLLLVAGGLGACGGGNTIEPPANLVSFDETLAIREVWSASVGEGSERLRLGLAPATDGRLLFAGAQDGTATAFNLTNGELVWSRETGSRLAAGPGVGGGIVVFGTTDGTLLALDAATGEPVWQEDVGSEVLAAPVVDDDGVAFRSVDGRLTTLAVEDGSELWTIVQSLPVLTLRGNSSPIVIGENVIAGFDNGRVGNYDMEFGQSNWEIQLASPVGRSEIDRLVDVGVDLEVFGNDVYAATFQGRAAAVDLTSGAVLWERDFSSFTGIGVDIQNVYVTSDVSSVVALNRRNGNEVWRQEALRLRDVTAASRFRDTVVVADYEGYVHFLSASDGRFVGRHRVGSGQITAQPLALGPLLFVQSEDGTLAALEIVDRSS